MSRIGKRKNNIFSFPVVKEYFSKTYISVKQTWNVIIPYVSSIFLPFMYLVSKDEEGLLRDPKQGNSLPQVTMYVS